MKEDDIPKEEISEEDEEFMEEAAAYFDKIWPSIKQDLKELSKKELAREAFMLGTFMHKTYTETMWNELGKRIKEDPEGLKKAFEDNEDD